MKIAEDFKFNNMGQMVEPCSSKEKVKGPGHYKGYECRDAIKKALTEEEYRGWIKGDAIAYIWREMNKNGTEDLRKAVEMLNWLIIHEEVNGHE